MTYVLPDTGFKYGIRGRFIPDPTIVNTDAWRDVPLEHHLRWRFDSRAEMVGVLGGPEGRWEREEAGGDWGNADPEQLAGWLQGSAQRWVGDEATFDWNTAVPREGWPWQLLPAPTFEVLDVIETTLRSIGQLDVTEVDARVPVTRRNEADDSATRVGAGAGWLDGARSSDAGREVCVAIALFRGSGHPSQTEALLRALGEAVQPAGHDLRLREPGPARARPDGPWVDPLPYVPAGDWSIYLQLTIPRWDVTAAAWLIEATRLAALVAGVPGSIGVGVRAQP